MAWEGAKNLLDVIPEVENDGWSMSQAFSVKVSPNVDGVELIINLFHKQEDVPGH